jgi:tellurite resistance protein TerC
MLAGWEAWFGFTAFVVVMLAFDLGILQRRAHVPTFGQSLILSILWIGLAFLFNVGVWYWYGFEPAMQFLTGYLIEKTLSIDNLFVFVMIFAWFEVPKDQQHRVLFWGVIGALLLRGVFIAGGVMLIHRFAWTTWLFGALLLYTAGKMFRSNHQAFSGGSNLIVKTTRRFLPISNTYDGQRLITRRDGAWKVTPLFLALLVVELTDVMFAIDSIPAILAITDDPFIVFTSNVFAILGLRALYFLLSGFLERLHYLTYGLAAILFFVGTKMISAPWIHVSVVVSLGVIAAILAIAAVASIVHLLVKKKVAHNAPGVS